MTQVCVIVGMVKIRSCIKSRKLKAAHFTVQALLLVTLTRELTGRLSPLQIEIAACAKIHAHLALSAQEDERSERIAWFPPKNRN